MTIGPIPVLVIALTVSDFVAVKTGLFLQNQSYICFELSNWDSVNKQPPSDGVEFGKLSLSSLSQFRLIGRSEVPQNNPSRITKLLMGPRKYHSLENVLAINFLGWFWSFDARKQGVSSQTMIDYEFWQFWQCPMSTYKPEGSAYRTLPFWLFWACSMVNRFSTVRKMRFLLVTCGPTLISKALIFLKLIQFDIRLIFTLIRCWYRFHRQFSWRSLGLGVLFQIL